MNKDIDKLMRELSHDKFRSTRGGRYNDASLLKDCNKELGLSELPIVNKGEEGGGSQVLSVLQYQILTLYKRIEELENKESI